MIQRHSIILWKKAEREGKCFEEFSKEAYEVLSLFQCYSEELRPNYLTAKTKKDIKEFDWNYKNFAEQLKKGINKEGEISFESLGYSISFFSSMDETNSCTFSMTVGNKVENVNNVLVVELPLSLNLYEKKVASIVCDLFEKLVQIYKPFWGCISNKALSRKYGRFLNGNLPTTVHWMNYWPEDIVCTIGMEKIQSIVNQNAISSFKNGNFRIKETALDLEKVDDVRFHASLHKQLFL